MNQRSIKKTVHKPVALGGPGDSEYLFLLIEPNSGQLMMLNRFWAEAVQLSVLLVLYRPGTHLAVGAYGRAPGAANRCGLPLANSSA